MAIGVKGSILYGIVVTAVIGCHCVMPKPEGIVQLPSFADWAPVFGKFDIGAALSLGFLGLSLPFVRRPL